MQERILACIVKLIIFLEDRTNFPPVFIQLEPIINKYIDAESHKTYLVHGPDQFSVPNLRTKAKCYQLMLGHKLFSNLYDNRSE